VTKFISGSLLACLASIAAVASVGCGELPQETLLPLSSTDTAPNTTNSTTDSTQTTDPTGTTETTTSDPATGSSMCGSGASPFKAVASAANNMSLVTDLQITEVPVKGSSLDITFDWTNWTTDFFKHPVDRAEIVQVALVPWTVGLDVVQQGINVDDRNLTANAELPAVFNPLASGSPVTTAKITDFVDVGGAPLAEEALLNYLDPANGFSITLILQVDYAVGVGARMIQGFKPTAGEEATTVTVTDTSSTLGATAVFGEPFSVPAGQSDIMFDWSKLTERSFGGTFDSQLFEIIVGKYPADMDLEAGILDIDYKFENFWRGPVDGVNSHLNLSTLTDEAGAAFPGIDANSQYLVGMTWPEGTNPAPWFLTELTPCP
jgi:hypothetical protein